jgi:hypothetical protein
MKPLVGLVLATNAAKIAATDAPLESVTLARIVVVLNCGEAFAFTAPVPGSPLVITLEKT